VRREVRVELLPDDGHEHVDRDDETMHEAVKSVSEKWKNKKYSASACNCQDFVG
jgi:hypothetical protein